MGYCIYCHFQQYFSYIVAVSFIGGENRSTQRKPQTCRKSLTNLITLCCIKYTSPLAGFELSGIGKSNYRTSMSMVAPFYIKYIMPVTYLCCILVCLFKSVQ
jgi:hypothetical protein